VFVSSFVLSCPGRKEHGVSQVFLKHRDFPPNLYMSKILEDFIFKDEISCRVFEKNFINYHGELIMLIIMTIKETSRNAVSIC
jgi:hypothetical protein